MNGGGILRAADDGAAALNTGEIIVVIVYAVAHPVGADEEGKGLLVGGNIGGSAVGTLAAVGQIGLWRGQWMAETNWGGVFLQHRSCWRTLRRRVRGTRSAASCTKCSADFEGSGWR